MLSCFLALMLYCSNMFVMTPPNFLPPSSSRLAAFAAVDPQYKDLSTKVSSKLLTSAETAAESKDALADVNWGAPKATGLSIAEMAKRVDAGLRQECWFITGRSLPELFSNSFTFSDPQVRCCTHATHWCSKRCALVP